MSKCVKCGSDLADDAVFCSGCGEKVDVSVVCPQCGEKANSDLPYCMKCGVALSENSKKNINSFDAIKDNGAKIISSVTPAAKEALEQIKTKSSTALKKMNPKILAAAAAGVAVLLLIAAVLIINPFAPKYKLPLTYMKDGEINFTALSKIKPIEASSDLGGTDNVRIEDSYYISKYIQFSDDGKYMFYPDKSDGDSISIYYRNLKKDNNKADAAVKIDSEINNYSISKNGSKVFYIKGSSGNLYVHNLKEKEKIDSDVQSFYIDENGSNIVYLKNEDNTLYYRETGKNKEKKKIDSEIRNLAHVSSDLKKVYYIKDDSLYLKELGKDKVKIASDVYDVVTVYENGSLYLTKNEDEEIKLIDYVTDDLAEADRSLTEPRIEDFNMQQNDGWGVYTVTDWTKYYEAQQKYNEKVNRDTLRGNLENEKMTINNRSLYFYEGKKETAITDNISNIESYSVKKPVIAYSKYNRSEISKMKLSEITSISDVKSLIEASQTSSSEKYAAINAKETVIDQTNGINYSVNNEGDAIYFLDDYSEEKNYGTLMELKVGGGKITDTKKVDEDVSSFNNTKNGLFYFKDVKGNKGDLYQKGKMLSSDVSINSLNSIVKSDAIICMTDFSDSSKSGTVTIIKNGKAKNIADDVAQYVVFNEKAIAYLSDYSDDRQKGDAFLYTGSSKPKKIDEDVTLLIQPYISDN